MINVGNIAQNIEVIATRSDGQTTLIAVAPAVGGGGGSGLPGEDGWSPLFAVASDNARRVLQVSDWTGGEGTKPDTGAYLGSAGLVALIADAVDIRGPQGEQGVQGEQGETGEQGIQGIQGIQGETGEQGIQGEQGVQGETGDTGLQGDTGATGDDGWSPEFAIVSDGFRRVLQVSDWAGGEGTKPATGDYVGPTGLVASAAAAVDIRGPEGAAGADGADGVDGEGAGSVTSVDVTGGTGIESSGGPVTTSGAITVALDSATQASLGKADTAVQPAAITDFETTTQLNARDTANRSRTNHTGTQAIATVTGLQTALDSKATSTQGGLADTAAQLAGAAFTGNVSTTGLQSAKQYRGSEQVVLPTGTTATIDLTAGTNFTFTPSGDATITINPDTANAQAMNAIVTIVNTGGHSVTWEAASGSTMYTDGGVQPDAPASGDSGRYSIIKNTATTFDLIEGPLDMVAV